MHVKIKTRRVVVQPLRRVPHPDGIAGKKQRQAAEKKNLPRPPREPLPLRIAWLAVLAGLGCLLFFSRGGGTKSGDGAAQQQAPAFDADGWLSTAWQSKTEDFLRTESLLGRKLLPLKNQIDLELFHQLGLADCVVGKGGYLLTESGIRASYGMDYLGDKAIAEKLRKVKLIQDSLAKRGISLVMLYVPTKEFLMPELVPDAWRGHARSLTNIARFTELSRLAGINHLNYEAMLRQHMRGAFPVWPKLGSHWSYYAECLAVDSTIAYIERLRGQPMGHLVWNGMDTTFEARMRDADAINKIPLLRQPKGLRMGYPRSMSYAFAPGSRPVRTLGIGDSYYRGFEYTEAMKHPFGDGQFWYYFNTISPVVADGPEVWELDLRAELQRYEVVLVMVNAGNMANTGNGFIEEAYELYTRPAAYAARIAGERPLRREIKSIRKDPEQLDKALRRSKDEGISLDSAIVRMARENLL